MRLARVRTPDGAVPVVWTDGGWQQIDDLFAESPRRLDRRFDGDAPLAAPVAPRVVLGMAHNSGADDAELPPQAFAKSARTVVGPGDAIVLDPAVGAVVAEGELAVVMRRRSRHLKAEEVAAHVLGCTIGNDVTAVDQLARDSLLTQAKNGDGFTPLGPWIETGVVPGGTRIRAEAGDAVASGSIDGLARGVVELLVYLTSVLELGPGDVVLTGCPGTAVPISPGDTARLRIDGLGELSNPVVAHRGQ